MKNLIFASALLFALPGPAIAAEEPLDAFAKQVGYMASTIPFCGGPPEELTYFQGLILKMLRPAKLTKAELARYKDLAEQARVAAKPRGNDCTDNGGLANAGKLQNLLKALVAARQ